MAEVKLSDLKPGMVTTEPVTTKRGQEIVPAGTALTKQLISRIEFYGLPSASIDDASIASEDGAAEPHPAQEPDQGGGGEGSAAISTPVNEVAYSQQVRHSKTFKEYSLNSTIVTKTLQDELEGFVNDGKEIDYAALLAAVKSLITPGQTIIQYFDMLHNLRSSDDSVYSHSLNVAMISRIIGKWLKWKESDLDTLVIAGLLHDIGKITIPPEILNKEEKLTDEEFELIKQHPQAGYDMLRDLDIDPRIKKAALQHHERCDGSGYPLGAKGAIINDFAAVIAIADVYDAMTAARKYRAPLCPFQVIREFERDGYHKYKTEFLLTFLQRIATTYQNNRVILSDGRAAKIILLNQNSLSEPLVQLNDGSCIDLASSPLYIQSIV